MFSSCVKEEGKVASGDTATTSGSNGGGTNGGTSTPNTPDPLAAQAWHLKNTGQNSYSTGTGIAGEDISLEGAIAEGFTGEGVRVAVSDSGTEVAHEDLTANQLTGEHRNYAYSNQDVWRGSLPNPMGNDSHGTATTGLIAAEGWNGLGSRGVAPDAKFGAFRFVINYTVSAASVLARNLDQTDGNFDIFNYSYGYGQCYFVEEDSLMLDAFKSGVTNLRSGKGALYIQSAGNDFTGDLQDCAGTAFSSDFTGNTNYSDDTAIPEKIIVGAVTANGLKSSYSTAGSGIWVSAPGGEFGTSSPAMIAPDLSGCSKGYSIYSYALNAFNRGQVTGNTNCNYTSYMNGTSSAAPVVSGVVALMLQANPSLSWRDVKHILALTADKVDYSLIDLSHPLGLDVFGHVYDWKWIQNANGLEFSNWYGFGRVNALQAVLAANTYSFPLGGYEATINPQTQSWYYDSGTLNETIPDHHGIPLTPVTELTSEIEVKHNFFVEAVQVQLSITHDAPSDLSISLISPLGTESRLIHINNGIYAAEFPANKLLLSNAFYSEESFGTWTLKILDGNAGDEGTLTNWKINIHGHRIQGDGSYPNRPTALTAVSTFPSPFITPPLSFTHSTSVDVVRYEMSVGTSPGLADKAGWTSIGMNNSNVQLGSIQLNLNTGYYLNIRAIDSRENASSIATHYWYVN